MKSIRVFVFLWVCFAALPSFSAMRIEDPQNILEQSDSFLGAGSFTSAFRCQDKATYENNECRLNCTETGCQEICEPAVKSELMVVACTSEYATIRREMPGEPSKEQTVTEDLYHSLKGNMFRYLLEQMSEGADEKDFVKLEHASVIHYLLPSGQGGEGINVFFTIHDVTTTGGSQSEVVVPLSVTFGKDLPAVAQLLDLMIMPGLAKTPQMRLLSVERHQ